MKILQHVDKNLLACLSLEYYKLCMVLLGAVWENFSVFVSSLLLIIENIIHILIFGLQ